MAANIKFKGFFSSSSTLNSAHPSPSKGDSAWVGSTYPGVVYECKTAGVWSNTNKAPNTPSVQLTDYATKALMDIRTTEYNVSVQHPTSGIDGTNKFTLAGAIALVPSALRTIGLKCSFLGEAGKVETWEYQGGTFTAVSSWVQSGTQKIAELENGILQTFTINGSFVTVGGVIAVDPTRPFCRTDYVCILKSRGINIVYGFQNPHCCSVAYYDINKKFISGITGHNDGVYSAYIPASEFPQNAVYAIGTSYTTYLNRLFMVQQAVTEVQQEVTEVQQEVTEVQQEVTEVLSFTRQTNYFKTSNQKAECSTFFKELYISGNVKTDKIYYLRLVCNNDTTFKNAIFIAESDADFSASKIVGSLLRLKNEDRNGIVTIPTINSSDLVMKAIVNWNAFPDGINTGEILRMVFNEKAFHPIYSPTIAYNVVDIPDLKHKMTNAVTSDEAGKIQGAYIDNEQLVPELGEKPADANRTYASGRGYAIYMRLDNAVVFKQASLPFYRTSTMPIKVTVKIAITNEIIKDGNFQTVFQPFVVAEKSFEDVEFNPTNKATTFVFDKTIKVIAGKYLYFCIGSDSTNLAIANFNIQNEKNNRHNWYYSLASDVFNGSWLSTSGSTFLQTQFTLTTDAPSTKDIQKLQTDVTQLQTDVTQLQTDATQLQTDVDNLQTDVDNLQNKIVATKLCCPDKYFAVVGQEFNLYYDGVIKALDAGLQSPFGIYIDIECPVLQNASNQIGVRRERMWQITGSKLTANYIGEHNLQITAWDHWGNMLDRKVGKLKIGSATPLNTVKYILCIGDSLTNNGPIVATCGQHFAEIGGTQPIFIGQRITSGYRHEGYPGYTFGSFVSGTAGYKYRIFDIPNETNVSSNDNYSTNGTTYKIMDIRTEGLDNKIRIRCELVTGINEPAPTGILTKVSGAGTSPETIEYSAFEAESGNPFWDDESKADNFTKYRQKMNMGANKFDIVFIMLGTNDCIGNIKPSMQSSVNDAKTLISAILSDAGNYPTKILLQMTPPDANTISSWQVYSDSSGSGKKIGYWTNLWNLRQLLYDEFTKPEWDGKVILGAAALGCDRYYGFPYTNIQSSVRINTVEEIYHTNCVHPNKQGYQQIGDGFYLQAKHFL